MFGYKARIFEATISNEAASALEVKGFRGRILVVDSPETMVEAYSIMKGERVLGVDTETRPAFQKGVFYPLALLQVSTHDTALLFRVQREPLSKEVISVMEDRRVLKIGAALRDDIKALQTLCPFVPNGFVDLQNIINEWGVEEKSVRKMAAIVLGFKVSKAQRLSNWEATRLTDAQQNYAAMDAWACLEIYRVLQKTPKVKKIKQPVVRPKTEK